MKILNSRKKVISALMLSAIALTGCSKVNTVEYNGKLYNIEDNSLLKDFDDKLTIGERLTYNSTGLSLFIMPGQYNNQLSIEYDTHKEASDDVYEYINKTIDELTEYDTLSIYLSKGNLDFSKVDVSKFQRIMFSVSDIDFDYTPFYNKTYNFLMIDVSSKTNIDSVVKFLENINTEEASIYINFKDDMKVEDSQRVVNTLAKMKNVDTIELSSSIINDLNVADLASHTLTLHNPTTDNKLNYDLTINDDVEILYVESSYDEKYEGEGYLESFKVNSNNKKLWTHYQIYRYADSGLFNISADDQSIINIPDNTELHIAGLDIANVSNDWLRNFANLESVAIRPYAAFRDTFTFDRDKTTIDEAIEEKEYYDVKDIVDERLEEIGINYNISSNGYISIRGDYDNTGELVPEEFYTVLNKGFKDASNDYLIIENLDNQLDFSRVDLTNIKRINLEITGPNFDFTPFYNQNISYLNLVIGENANHEGILEFLNNLPEHNMIIYVRFHEDLELQDPKIQQQYIDILSNKDNLKDLTIDTNIVNQLNIENLVAENLSIFTENGKDEINYDITINDKVKNFSILTSYDEEYTKKAYIGDIKVNSNNKSLITNLYFHNYGFEFVFNVNLDNDIANIKVPNTSGLRIVGVNFNDIDYEAIEALDYLRYLYICEEGNEDYAFCYHYKDNTFEDALDTFKKQNSNNKGKSLIIK